MLEKLNSQYSGPPSKSFENLIVLTLAGKKIFESRKVKYLGIILDDCLNWKIHINELCKKLSRTVGMLFKIRHQCNKRVLRSLYFSLFESHLSYALPVWGSAIQAHMQKLFILQKKAIRAISFSDFRAHTSPLFKELNTLKIDDLFQYQVSSLMWDFDHNTLPNALNSLFNKTRNTHSYGTRFANADKLNIERTNTSRYGLMSFKVIGASKLNELKDCDNYNNASSTRAFLNSLKENRINAYKIKTKTFCCERFCIVLIFVLIYHNKLHYNFFYSNSTKYHYAWAGFGHCIILKKARIFLIFIKNSNHSFVVFHKLNLNLSFFNSQSRCHFQN